MKIIIAGAGEVGFHLAKLLSYESQEITLIDPVRDSLTFAEGHLDIKVLNGDSTSIKTLNDANASDADLFIGVTALQATNLTACFLAKQLGAKKTIARISNSEYNSPKNNINFSDLGVDELISPGDLATHEIAMNTADQKIYTKDSGGNIVTVASHTEGIATEDDILAFTIALG